MSDDAFSPENMRAFFATLNEWKQAAMAAGSAEGEAFALVRPVAETLLLREVSLAWKSQAERAPTGPVPKS